MLMKKIFILLCLCGAVALSPLLAKSEASSVQEVAKRYLAATKLYKPKEMVKYMHSEALKQFRSLIMNSMPDKEKVIQELTQTFALKSKEEFKQLSDSQFYVKYNEAIIKQNPQMAELMHRATFTILGVNKEGGLRHVQYRTDLSINGQKESEVNTFSFKKDANVWRALLRSRISQ